MVSNIRAAAPEAASRFTPLLGLSEQVIPKWLAKMEKGTRIDLAFLDGGNNPLEQIREFELIEPYIPVGGIVFSHDAKLRKGKWLVPYVSRLDNWETYLHDVSAEGLFYAKKIADKPSPAIMRKARFHLWRMRLAPASWPPLYCQRSYVVGLENITSPFLLRACRRKILISLRD